MRGEHSVDPFGDTDALLINSSGPDGVPLPQMTGRTLWIARTLWGAAILLAASLMFIYLYHVPVILQNPESSDLFENITNQYLSQTVFPTVSMIRRLFLATCGWFMALMICWRRTDRALVLWTSLAIVGISTYPLNIEFLERLMFRDELGEIWRAMAAVQAVLGASIGIGIMLVMPSGRLMRGWGRWLYPFVLIFPTIYAWVWWAEYRAYRPAMVGNVLTITVAALVIFFRYWETTQPREKLQLRWLLLGNVVCAVVFALYVVLVLSPTPTSETLLIAKRFSQDVILLLGYSAPLLTFFLVISRYKLWSFHVTINRSLVYSTLTLSLAVVFLLGFLLLRKVFRLVGIEQDLWAVAILIVSIMLLYQPLRTRFRRFIDRRFYGIDIDYEEANRLEVLSGRTRLAPQKPLSRFGEYEELRWLGRGGMGEVFRAKHPILERDVAIKLLAKAHKFDKKVQERFTREAQALAKLNHPHIIKLHDFGEESGQSFMVMEYIDGEELRDRLQKGERLPLEEVLKIVGPLASALDHVHQHGIIHRDIKPNNVMLERNPSEPSEPRVILMDFGIARIHSMETLTEAGGEAILGTLSYIPPEQVKGDKNIDGRADLYSLACMVYRMLTGQMPFVQKDPISIVMAHLMHIPPSPKLYAPELPEYVAEAILKALSKEPKDRFATVGEFFEAIKGETPALETLDFGAANSLFTDLDKLL